MATKTKLEKLVDEAIALGLTLNGDETEANLTEAITAKKQEIADAKKAEAEAKKAKKVYHWVKVKSFIDDSKTVEIGLYETAEANERLARSSKAYVETFVGKIPDAKLFEIAKIFRVAVFEKNGEDARPSAEILAELVKEL